MCRPRSSAATTVPDWRVRAAMREVLAAALDALQQFELGLHAPLVHAVHAARVVGLDALRERRRPHVKPRGS